MFSRSDFPDFKTEAAETLERHGPPPMTEEENAAWEAKRRKTEAEIATAYEEGASLSKLQSSFPSVSESQIRRAIAAVNYSRQFPNPNDESLFLYDLEQKCCHRCRNEYLSESYRKWRMGKKLRLPKLPNCVHRA
jgi:hypothetical protein